MSWRTPEPYQPAGLERGTATSTSTTTGTTSHRTLLPSCADALDARDTVTARSAEHEDAHLKMRPTTGKQGGAITMSRTSYTSCAWTTDVWRRRQDLWTPSTARQRSCAASSSLNAPAMPAALEPAPLVTLMHWADGCECGLETVRIRCEYREVRVLSPRPACACKLTPAQVSPNAGSGVVAATVVERGAWRPPDAEQKPTTPSAPSLSGCAAGSDSSDRRSLGASTPLTPAFRREGPVRSGPGGRPVRWCRSG